MSLQRRSPGRPRFAAAVGALVILGGTLLPWWTVGGSDALPMRTGNAFESSGILVFAAALATIAILTLPYASERPVAVDRWTTYALIAGVGWAAYAYRVVDLALSRAFEFDEPTAIFTQIPGLWVTFVGLAILARAAYDIHGADRRR
jgi:hypothetical protein